MRRLGLIAFVAVMLGSAWAPPAAADFHISCSGPASATVAATGAGQLTGTVKCPGQAVKIVSLKITGALFAHTTAAPPSQGVGATSTSASFTPEAVELYTVDMVFQAGNALRTRKAQYLGIGPAAFIYQLSNDSH